MASITLSGKVVGKAGEPAVTIKEIPTNSGQTLKIASFSLLDRDRVRFKNRDDNPGQFYKIELVGRDAEYALEQIQLGTHLAVTGQPVWRKWNDQKILDIKNSRYWIVEDRNPSNGADAF